MIPISDQGTIRIRRPVVNIALIAISTLVFIYELSLSGIAEHEFFFTYGLIAAELSGGVEFVNLVETIFGPIPLNSVDAAKVASGGIALGPGIDSPIPTWGTVFTSMFVHGGIIHFAGNMLFLWVFGDNVEDRLGHVKYLLFYLGAGVAAAWTQVAVDMDSQVPMVGASGAIAGVLGAYLLLYPYNRITTLIFFFFITVIQLPALFVLGFWFVLQLFNGLGSLGPSAAGGGVAYMAHIGGFAAGVLFMAMYKVLLLREPIWPRRPYGHHWRDFRR